MKTENKLELIKKKVVGILIDYKFNSTQTETTEQFVERIIEIIKQALEEKKA